MNIEPVDGSNCTGIMQEKYLYIAAFLPFFRVCEESFPTNDPAVTLLTIALT